MKIRPLVPQPSPRSRKLVNLPTLSYILNVRAMKIQCQKSLSGYYIVNVRSANWAPLAPAKPFLQATRVKEVARIARHEVNVILVFNLYNANCA
ncbi:hypothetical protein BdWA1_003067 [Babesia duncani]|uniref:Uncharacterized protein n=1 Tax=Babesia duncani TaxID=323732 RepID=A0AAD9PIB8_9APIC|nr:hypothetical protein BdWA1_003067 [Babesia duncani]